MSNSQIQLSLAAEADLLADRARHADSRAGYRVAASRARTLASHFVQLELLQQATASQHGSIGIGLTRPS